MHAETIGHPSGQLSEVDLTIPFGIAFQAPSATKDRLAKLWRSLDMYSDYISSVDDRDCPLYRHSPYHNWSTVDLDQYIVSKPHLPKPLHGRIPVNSNRCSLLAD